MSVLSRFWSGAGLAAALLSSPLVTRAAAPPGRYTISAGTVFDTKTRLTWQQTSPVATFTWGSAATAGTAQNYCATLNLSGIGWRLPSMKELVTLADYSVAQPGPAIDLTAFPGAPATLFWSSTTVAGSPGLAWEVNFTRGSAGTANVANTFSVRCVR
jgi:hypothetical protein